jgi:hypothetical protein
LTGSRGVAKQLAHRVEKRGIAADVTAPDLDLSIMVDATSEACKMRNVGAAGALVDLSRNLGIEPRFRQVIDERGGERVDLILRYWNVRFP